MYPILEFDPDRKSFVEPSDIADSLDVSEYCIICFFGEVIEKVVSEHKAEVLTQNRWEDGPHPLFLSNEKPTTLTLENRPPERKKLRDYVRIVALVRRIGPCWRVIGGLTPTPNGNVAAEYLDILPH